MKAEMHLLTLLSVVIGHNSAIFCSISHVTLASGVHLLFPL